MKVFTVGDEVVHRVDDRGCPGCQEGYPEPCRCGGWMHAAGTDEQDADGNPVLLTACDVCGRSDDMLDEV